MARNNSTPTRSRRSVLKATGALLATGVAAGAASASSTTENGVTAEMHGSDETPENDEYVHFDGTQSTSEHGEIVEYEWTFDAYDDSGQNTYTRTGAEVDHAFKYVSDPPEGRTAKLTVTDEHGNSATTSHQLTVYYDEPECVPYGCDDDF